VDLLLQFSDVYSKHVFVDDNRVNLLELSDLIFVLVNLFLQLGSRRILTVFISPE